MKSSSDVVRRKFTPREVQPTTLPTDHEEKKLASEIKNDRTTAINFQDIEKVKIVDSTENSGFYCKDCNLSCKDSVSFLDHLNSRVHQRNLGIEMRVEKSSLDQVKARIEYHKKKLNIEEINVSEYLLQKIKNDQESKISKRKLKKESRKLEKLKESTEPVDSPVLQQMGFSSFK
jgi:U4/U6.U5 tri-snRNP component SNU23